MPMFPPCVEWKDALSPAREPTPSTIDLNAEKPRERPPMRTYSVTHPQAGFLEVTVPYMNPEDVEAYLMEQLAELPTIERFTLHNDLMKIAMEMWSGYALWVGDPTEARLWLRNDDGVARWFNTKETP